jgi:hypothetical protein
VHADPAAQLAWHGGASQRNAQLLSLPHVQLPLAHVPSQWG